MEAISITPANGKLLKAWAWTPKPGGLVVALAPPCSHVSAASQHSRTAFTTCAFDSSGNYLGAADSTGNVFLFNLKENRYVRLEKTGSAGTCAAFSRGTGRLTLFVGLKVRCVHVCM